LFGAGKTATAEQDPNYLEWYRQTIPLSWTVPEHVRLIAEHLDAVNRGEIDRLAIHMPPRHGKSETVTVRAPLYDLERAPESNVLVTGYNERFARKFGRKTRNLAVERGLVSADKTASDEWATKRGGLYMARGVGSPPTGTGFARIYIDDPIRRREDADSEIYREKTWDWYTDDLYTRLEPGGAIILTMTLWHEDDLGARAVASEPGKWTVLKLPAISDVGEALWPERFSAKDLNRIREAIKRRDGERSWEALYQQNPSAREGSFFKVDRFRFIDRSDFKAVRRVRSWDVASSQDKGDFTAGVLMGVDVEGRYCVEHVRRGQWATDERRNVIRQTAEMDGPEVIITGPEDPGAAGKDAGLDFTRRLAGFNVKLRRPDQKKELRADAYSAQVNAGNVFLARGDWTADYVEECRTFPSGKNDDQIDGSSDAFNELQGPRTITFF
jgi:predicted phage terminase large subunit-like protein